MNHVRHRKYKSKQLNNTQVLTVKNSILEFKLNHISINDIDSKNSKERMKREENICKKTCVIIDTIG